MPRTSNIAATVQTPATGAIGMSDMNAATRIYSDLNRYNVAGGFTSSDETTKVGGTWNNKASLSEMWSWYARRMFPIPQGTNIDSFHKSQLTNQGTLGTVGTSHQTFDGDKKPVKFSDFRDHTCLQYYERVKPRAEVSGYADVKNGAYSQRFLGHGTGDTVKVTCDGITKTATAGSVVSFLLGATKRVHAATTSWHFRQVNDHAFNKSHHPVQLDWTASSGVTIKTTNKAVMIGLASSDWFGTVYYQSWCIPYGGVTAGWGKWLQFNGTFPLMSFTKYTGVGFGDMGQGSWSYAPGTTDGSGNSRDPLPGTYTYVDMVDFGVGQPNTWAVKVGGDNNSKVTLPTLGLSFTGAGFSTDMPPSQNFTLPAGANRYQKIEVEVTNGTSTGTYQGRNPCAVAAAIWNTSKPEQVVAIGKSNTNYAFGDERHKLTWTSRQSGNWYNGIMVCTDMGSRVSSGHVWGDPMMSTPTWGEQLNWINWGTTGVPAQYLHWITKVGYDFYTGEVHVGEAPAVNHFKFF